MAAHCDIVLDSSPENEACAALPPDTCTTADHDPMLRGLPREPRTLSREQANPSTLPNTANLDSSRSSTERKSGSGTLFILRTLATVSPLLDSPFRVIPCGPCGSSPGQVGVPLRYVRLEHVSQEMPRLQRLLSSCHQSKSLFLSPSPSLTSNPPAVCLFHLS